MVSLKRVAQKVSALSAPSSTAFDAPLGDGSGGKMQYSAAEPEKLTLKNGFRRG